MSQSLDSYQNKPTIVFEGKVKNISYHQTARQDEYALIEVRGLTKPLAIPTTRKYEIPHYGDHVSVEAVELDVWYIPIHRAVVVIKQPDYVTWAKPSEIDMPRRQQAESIILEYATKNNSVSADDVAAPICALFPERDARIVGAIFLGLSKKGIIHKYGFKRTERTAHHGSDLAVWHLVVKK